MITGMAFAMFLGLLVFGPKKTLEMSQTVGRVVANLKHAAGQLQTQMLDSQILNPQIPEQLTRDETNGQLRIGTNIVQYSDPSSPQSTTTPNPSTPR